MKHKVEKTEAAIDYIEGHLSEMLNLELGAMAVSVFCLFEGQRAFCRKTGRQ